MRKILLNPGPVTLSDQVRAAAVSADYCHREERFLELQSQVVGGVTAVYQCDPSQWTTVTLGGSGTLAMEAMLASLVPQDARLLVVENGVYGERLSRIASVHGIGHRALHFDWGSPPDLDMIDKELESADFSHMAVVHHETTTGRLNPLEDIADICQRHSVRLMVDAVSSFGAEELPFGHAAVAACAGTANKCLHGIPGLAFVTLRRELLSADVPVRSLYLHLPAWAAAQDAGSTPFTPPVNAYLALQQALADLDEQGGWRARRERYLHLAEGVRATLAERGVGAWLSPAESSCALRSYEIPGGLNYNDIHEGFERQGFIIYAGQGGLSGKMFRISTMGDISDQDYTRLQEVIRHVF